MYIIIDLDNLRFTHKAEDCFSLANIAWIEHQSISYEITHLENALPFVAMNDVDLKMLFRNTTGQECPSNNHTLTAKAVHDLAIRYPETTCRFEDTESQAEQVPEGDSRLWKFVQRSKRPALLQELPLFYQKVDPVETLSRIATGDFPEIPKPAAPAPAPGHDREPGATPGPAKAKAPKRGSTAPIIWEYADRIWSEHGKPMEKDEVLKVRKQIMNELEEKEAIKRTTSSSELAKWHKDRAPH